MSIIDKQRITLFPLEIKLFSIATIKDNLPPAPIKTPANGFGDGVKIKIDLSSPFLGLERESPKNSRASPVSCRMEIDLIFTKSI